MRRAILPLLLLAAPLILLNGCSIPGTVDAAATDSTRRVIPPEERDPARLWCNEHDHYEDECYICHPELAPEEQHAAEEAAHDEEAGDHDGHGHASHEERDGVLWCREHDVPEAECGVCQPQLMDELPVGTGMKMRVSEPAVLETAGLSATKPLEADASAGSELLGRVTYNRNQLALVTPLAAGVITEVDSDVGDTVNEGTVLAKVRAAGVTEGATNYLKAVAEADFRHKAYLREKDLFEREISARQDFEAAEAAWRASQKDVDHGRQHLLNLGVSDSEIAAMASGGSVSGDLPVRAPFTGTIVERDAVVGTAVEPGDAIFHVADLSSMWLALSVPESRLSSLQQGMPLQVRLDAYPGVVFEGSLSWIGASVDPDTRMVEARAALPNPQGLLKDGMFARARLGGAAQAAAMSVPEQAVQLLDGRPIVFARLEENLFEARLVELGPTQDNLVAVTRGLAPGEEVMTGETYILKSELLKSRLGAGCADH